MRLLASPESLAAANAHRRAGLEDELGAYLADSSRRSVRDLTELAAVSVPHHRASKEVGMVEDVEHLETQVQCHGLGDFRIFLNACIRVDSSRPVEQELFRAPGYAKRFVALVAAAETSGESGCAEVLSNCRTTRIQLMDWTHLGGIVEPEVG